jgi:hypothetical protein
LNRAFGAIHNVAYCFRARKNDEDANLFLDKELADMTAAFEQESGVEIKGK